MTHGSRARWAFPLIIAGLSMLGPFTVDTIFPGFSGIQSDLGVGATATQQLVSLYLVSFGLMSLVHGPLSDALGRKPVILGSLAIYAIASIGCALAESMPVLLAFRVLQGLSAGGSVIVSRTVVVDLFSGAEAQRLMSRVTMIFGLAPAVAPIVGGWLLALGTWPLIFWFLAGLAALLAGAAMLLPETHPPARRTPLRPAPLVASVREVARSRRFVRLAFVAALGFASFFVWIGASAIFVVDHLGLGEQDFWVLFVPMIIGIIGGSFISGQAAGRVDPRVLITSGLGFALFAALGNLVLLVLAPEVRLPWVVIGPALVALGVLSTYPVLQLRMVELFPATRGSATSVATVLSLLLNALIVGALTPWVAASLLTMAVSGALLIGAALALWLLHMRLMRATWADEGLDGPTR